MTTATTTEQRYWDDVAEGDELTGFDLYLSETKVAEQVSGSQDFYAVHHDRPFARAGGHEADIKLKEASDAIARLVRS